MCASLPRVTVGRTIWLQHSHWALKSQVPTERCSFVQGSPEVPSWWRFDKMWTLAAEMKCEIEEPSNEAARHRWNWRVQLRFTLGNANRPQNSAATCLCWDLASWGCMASLSHLHVLWMKILLQQPPPVMLQEVLPHRKGNSAVSFYPCGVMGWKSPGFYQPTWNSL